MNSSIEWIDKVVADWREYMLVCNYIRVSEGEIPSAQAEILADASAYHLRALLVEAENTRLELAITDTDRKRIAEWLRSTARTVAKKRSLFTKRFRAALYR